MVHYRYFGTKFWFLDFLPYHYGEEPAFGRIEAAFVSEISIPEPPAWPGSSVVRVLNPLVEPVIQRSRGFESHRGQSDDFRSPVWKNLEASSMNIEYTVPELQFSRREHYFNLCYILFLYFNIATEESWKRVL